MRRVQRACEAGHVCGFPWPLPSDSFQFCPEVFQSITGIVGLPDGGLVVLDAGSRELRWFDAAGEHVPTAGRRGQGPGEFLNPVVPPQFQSDSLLIFDRARRAFTWVALDGSGERTARPDGRLFVGTPQAATESRAAFRLARPAERCVDNEFCEASRVLRWITLTGTLADTLAVYPKRMLSFREAGLPAVLLGGPFDQQGLAAMAPDGPVIEGDPHFELRQFDREGGLIAIFRVDGTGQNSFGLVRRSRRSGWSSIGKVGHGASSSCLASLRCTTSGRTTFWAAGLTNSTWST